MKKVKIKINASELEVLNRLLCLVEKSTPTLRESKALKSALLPVIKKLSVKGINDYPKSQKMDFTMAFYEAHYMEIFLQDLGHMVDDEYSINFILKLKNYLHQQVS